MERYAQDACLASDAAVQHCTESDLIDQRMLMTCVSSYHLSSDDVTTN